MANEAERRVRQLLGWGIAAPLISPEDIGRDIAFARRTNGNVDLACVVGVQNLGQDLAMSLTTARGEDPLNTDFGFDGLLAFVEETSTNLIRERLRASVAKAVASDPRVRAVTAVDIQDTDPALRILDLRVSVDTIAGSSVEVGSTVPVVS
jgi:phage baseplate assembly protein W